MKTVLVPLIDADDTAPLLSAAVTVAKDFDSLIEGFCFKPVNTAPAFFEAAPTAMDESFERRYREQADLLRESFFEYMKKNGVSEAAPPSEPGKLGARWVDEVQAGYPYVSLRARLFDLIVVPQGSGSRSNYARGVFEAALFEGGRPVLMTPRDQVAQLGRKIVISWNGSDESVRAIVFAMPFLKKAEMVWVLSVEGAMVPGPNAGEVSEYLDHHGIKNEATGVRPGDISAGEAILQESGRLGADLLIKGAYTHSRIRQMVFGGATRHIVEHATIPVLMAH